MAVSELPRGKVSAGASRLIAKASRFRFVFTLSSSAYCAIHWLVTHSFSIYMFSGALLFGVIATMAAMAAMWLSDWFSTPSST
jgi:hypothetical protein